MINSNLEFQHMLNQWFSTFCCSRLFLGAQYYLRPAFNRCKLFRNRHGAFFPCLPCKTYYGIIVDTVRVNLISYNKLI